jgi:hypothetical protein
MTQELKESEIRFDKLGTQYHYKNGQLHCETGPAIIYGDNVKEWWFEGQSHRLDGPAVTSPSGNIHIIKWYVHGVQLTEEQFNEHPLVIAYQEKQKLENTLMEQSADSSKRFKL